MWMRFTSWPMKQTIKSRIRSYLTKIQVKPNKTQHTNINLIHSYWIFIHCVLLPFCVLNETRALNKIYVYTEWMLQQNWSALFGEPLLLRQMYSKNFKDTIFLRENQFFFSNGCGIYMRIEYKIHMFGV